MDVKCYLFFRPIFIATCVATMCFWLNGCATQSWTRDQINMASNSASASIEEQTRVIRSQLDEATAQNEESYKFVENLMAETKRLEETLAEITKNLSELNTHVSASLKSQSAELNAAIKKGDRNVRDTVIQEHQASIDAMKSEMLKVEEAGKRAEDFAQTLRRMLEVYDTANKNWPEK